MKKAMVCGLKKCCCQFIHGKALLEKGIGGSVM